MRIKFRSVHIHNFLSISDEVVKLNDMGCTIVTGINTRKVDNAESNGSGKSTIFNAICYALTGETAQGLSDNIENIYADPDDCWVELTFDVDDTEFIVKRIKTPRTDMKIYINGVNASGKGIKESTRILNNYLPDLTSRLLGSIIILGQGLPYKFTSNNPSSRKEMLEKLTKSDYMIQSIREKLDHRMAELKTILRSYEDSMVANSTQLGMLNRQINQCELELSDLNNTEIDDVSTIDNKILELSNMISEISKTKELILNDQSQINSKINSLTKDYYANVNKTNDSFTKSNMSLVELVANANASIKSIKNEIKKAESISDTCPTCGQKIPDEMKIDISPLKLKLEEESNALKQLNIQEYETKHIKETKLLDLKTEYDKNQYEYQAKLRELSDSWNQKDLEYKAQTTNLNSLKELKLKLEHINDNRTKVLETIAKTKLEVNVLEEEKLKLDSEIITTNEHISLIQAMITLTKREFRGVLLENIIKYINVKCKEYSKQVFDTELLAFELNENYIDIKYDNKYYEALSGGEKQKVDIIIQLAIRDLLSTQLNIRSSLICFDEIFDNLDSKGCQNIIELILKLKDIDSIFIISHHASELQISHDNHIQIVKSEEGISKINIY